MSSRRPGQILGPPSMLQKLLCILDSVVKCKTKEHDFCCTYFLYTNIYTKHFSDCYFKVSGHSKKSKRQIIYPNCPSALRPVSNASENIPVSSPPSQLELRADEI